MTDKRKENSTFCPICRNDIPISKDPYNVFYPNAYSLQSHMKVHSHQDVIKEFVAFYFAWGPIIEKIVTKNDNI